MNHGAAPWETFHFVTGQSIIPSSSVTILDYYPGRDTGASEKDLFKGGPQRPLVIQKIGKIGK